MMFSDRLYGLESPPDPVCLEAGPFSLQLVGDSIRHFKCNGLPLASRVFFAVRDTAWGTLENHIHDRVIQSHGQGLRINLRGSARRNDIALSWSSEITLSDDGRLSYLVSGRAKSDFACNRISLLVHYPQEAAGAETRCHMPDGRVVESHFPTLISAEDPYAGFEQFAHEAFTGHWLKVDFAGQLCQLEDQRNFGDDGFKIFYPPMNTPLPIEYKKGQEFECRVDLRLEPVPAQIEIKPGATRITLHGPTEHNLIKLGHSINDLVRSDDTNRDTGFIEELHPAHYRYVLDPRQPDWETGLHKAADFCKSQNTPLWLAVRAPVDDLGFVGKLADLQPQPERLILHPLEFWSPDYDALLAEMARVSEKYGLTCQVGVGNEHGFAMLHRNPPEFAGLDFITWAFNPQQHNTDLHTALENLGTPAHMARAMEQMAPGIPQAISPVTMRPIWNPHREKEDFDTMLGGLPRPVEPAQWGMFGAIWSLLSIKHLSQSPVLEATYFELTGPRGLLHQPTELHQPAFADLPGAKVYPLFHLFRELGARAGAEVWQMESTRPDLVDGLAVSNSDGIHLYLANQSGASHDVDLTDLLPLVEEAGSYSAADWINLVSQPDYVPPLIDMQPFAANQAGIISMDPVSILHLSMRKPESKT